MTTAASSDTGRILRPPSRAGLGAARTAIRLRAPGAGPDHARQGAHARPLSRTAPRRWQTAWA